MYCYYVDDSNVERYIFTILGTHDIAEIEKFLHDLQAANPNITVDDELYKWIEKKKEKAKRKKTLVDYFDVD
jgi:hypothetical protein